MRAARVLVCRGDDAWPWLALTGWLWRGIGGTAGHTTPFLEWEAPRLQMECVWAQYTSSLWLW